MFADLMKVSRSEDKDELIGAALSAKARENRMHDLRVLVAEDDADSRELLCHLLTSSGARCTAASSGSEAFHAFVRQRPDILIADIWMPDGDGFDLIHRIRAMTPEQGGLIPAIAISGGANGEQALIEGYHAFVAKPIDPDSVVGVVKEFVRPEREVPSPASCWAIGSPSPGRVVITFTGYVRVGDVDATITALLHYLEERPCRIVVDMRRLTGFSVAGASVAQRAVWPKRYAIEHVRFVGGSVVARTAGSATCRLLGIGCTVEGGEDAPPTL